ncbi:Nuclease SbcCD subunit C [termite gut metagenome]|uniref:Nuclease SbcCD subunit C n=1 Tax=termite gut metagenome TaxID=433724 RepID=A0A5J4S1P8_9ZZZZ
MKILAIRGKNLTSLEGEFEIDFTVEPLKSAGIYAITGNTGSGKSTLLDALCLALFDKMPRTNQVGENISMIDVQDKTINQRDSRTILRRGTGEGYAEVDFVSLGGEKFRSTWLVKRARGRADGSLQNSEIRLINLSANSEIQGKKTELLTKIIQLIGFSFEQFTRAVLLAQGDFVTFLKARQAEKAELLEKLTGTDIYSRISISIFNRSKKAEQDLLLLEERIKSIETLPDEQLELLETEKKTMGEETANLKNAITLLSEKIKWIKQDVILCRELSEAEKQWTDLQKKIQEAKPRYEYINKIESVQEIRDDFNEWQQARKQVKENETNLTKSEKERKANSLSLEQAKNALSACEKEQKEVEDVFAKTEPDIIKARELDVQLKTAVTNTIEIRKEVDAVKRSKEKLEQTILSLSKDKSSTQKSMDELNKWFEQFKDFAEIAPHVALLINLLNDAQTATGQSEEKRRAIEKEQAILDEDAKRLEILHQEIEQLNKELPAEIAVLREKLQEGIPCPVCGSTHHLLQRNNESSRLREEELNKVKQANEKKLQTLTENIEKAKNNIIQLTALRETYAKQSVETLAKAGEYLFRWSSWKDLFQQGTLQKRLKEQFDKWNNNTNNLTLLKGTLEKLDTNLINEQKNLREIILTLETKEQKQTETETTFARLTEERKKLLDGKPADAVSHYYASRKHEIAEKLKQSSDNKNKYISIEEGFKGKIEQIETELSRLKAQILRLHTSVDNWMAAKEDMTYEYLSELLSKDNAWLISEKQYLNRLRETEITGKATVAEREKNVINHRQAEIKPNKDEPQELLETELTEKTALATQKDIRSNEINALITSHLKGVEKIKSLEKELAEKRDLSLNWKKLNEMFGSATGTKFKEIAQGYTLDALLVYSNRHLQQLSGRYLLQRIPDTLALQVVDMDMLNEVRTVYSLSGGESFLVSLALALGLSSLSSNRMKVESLFIDEGFGSLDRDTLRIAMDTLERLQNQGRKIGVISHVSEITERIHTQIKVVKSTNGKSRIEIIG